MSLKFRLSLYLTFFSLLPLTTVAKTLDSLRIEKIKGTKFVVHRVDPKETLYSISKRYGTKIDEIYEYNESIENGLKMYDELYIPLNKKNNKKTKNASKNTETTDNSNVHIVTQGETLYSISRKYSITVDTLKKQNQIESNQISLGDTLMISVRNLTDEEPKIQLNENISEVPKKNIVYHKVMVSETLFGISKTYNVTIDQLTRWNAMDSYNLEIGKQLIVSSPDSSLAAIPISKIETKKDSVVEEATLDTLYVKTDNSLLRQQKTIEGKLEIVEEGFAMKIEDTDFTQKLLALHKTAPMGSLVTIKNQMTGKMVKVRVVGALPESGINKNVLLRLSTAAFNQLGALNMKVPIISSYVKE